MAQVEFTQVFSYVAAGIGATGFQYSQLQSVAGVYIVKSLTCYSTTGLTAGPPFSVQFVSSTDGTGSSVIPIYSSSTTSTANQIVTVFTPASQIILNRPWLGFDATMTAAGTFTVVISYSFIPNTNILSDNFDLASVAITNTTSTLLIGGATQASILKSIYVVNNTATGSVSVYPTLNNVALDIPTTVAVGATYQYVSPLYLNSAQTLRIVSTGAATVRAYVSYTTDTNS